MRPSNRCAPDWGGICAGAEPTPACCSPSVTRRRKERRNMAKVDWPAADKRVHMGKRISRIDAPLKTTGAAKYSYDINRPGMLFAKLVTSPHAKAEVTGVDTKAAQALPGVKAVWVDNEKQSMTYAGQIVAVVAAETEEIATESARLVKVTYNVQEHQVIDNDASLSKDKPTLREAGKVADAFADADSLSISGTYGIPVITH